MLALPIKKTPIIYHSQAIPFWWVNEDDINPFIHTVAVDRRLWMRSHLYYPYLHWSLRSIFVFCLGNYLICSSTMRWGQLGWRAAKVVSTTDRYFWYWETHKLSNELIGLGSSCGQYRKILFLTQIVFERNNFSNKSNKTLIRRN